jgi:hypothetical protein
MLEQKQVQQVQVQVLAVRQQVLLLGLVQQMLLLMLRLPFLPL